MLTPLWAEYARVQRLVESGNAKERQLDAFLKQYVDGGVPFDLHDCRRRLKNCERNTRRLESDRVQLLRGRYARLPRPGPLAPPDAAALVETRAAARRAAGRDWPLLRATADGDYAGVARLMRTPVGTLKSRVSRARAGLRKTLCRYSDE